MVIPKRLTLAVDLLFMLSRKPKRVSDLAHSLNTTTDFLQQIIGQLKAAGLVEVKRGPGGGVYNINDHAPVSKVFEAVSPLKISHDSEGFFAKHLSNVMFKGTLDFHKNAIHIAK